MSSFNMGLKAGLALLAIVAAEMFVPGKARAQMPQPLVSEESLTKVSDHAYVLAGFPNIGIVVGSRGTLVIDTGLGERNGATVLRVAQKLAKGPELYLTTTHYHSEHTTGEQAFPPNTIIIRNAAQQEELEKRLSAHEDQFRRISAQNADLLKEVHLRPPDITFDREMRLNLGGVTARLFWIGPAHTVGDELIFAEEDSVLFPGDIVQKTVFPILPNEDASIKGWLTILDQIEALHPRMIVPDHGDSKADASDIGKQRDYFLTLQARASELKKQGVSVDDAGKTLPAELQAKFPARQYPNYIVGEVRRAYEQAP
jgi:glyoxylase-like metal-dependent hydrolase (beta-lactamase superfamily II)